MTKKDFEAIAATIKDARAAIHALPNEANAIDRVFDSLSRDLSKVCALQNAKFQPIRFLKACGVDVVNQPLHRNK